MHSISWKYDLLTMELLVAAGDSVVYQNRVLRDEDRDKIINAVQAVHAEHQQTCKVLADLVRADRNKQAVEQAQKDAKLGMWSAAESHRLEDEVRSAASELRRCFAAAAAHLGATMPNAGA